MSDDAPPTVAIGRRALAAAREKAAPAGELPTVPRESYEILGELARGGLGRILRARDVRTDRVVAIKENIADDGDNAARRFAREALITANLQHPAIVPVYELGRWPSGEPFYAMKLVAGRSFEDVLRDAPTLAERLARLSVVISVAEALAYAHGCHIIHRDLKPANVLVGDFGETVVIDWGLAKVVGVDADDPAGAAPVPPIAASGYTVAGVVLGTPAYMAPEQARGEPMDARSDVYAIGAMLYRLITGDAPFGDSEAATPTALIAAVADDAPTRVARLAPDIPADLATIVDKAMARDPAARYPTAAELADDLKRFTTGQLVRAHRYDRRSLLVRWARRNRAAVTVAAALAAVLVAVAIVGVVRIVAERDRARAATTDARTALATALLQKGRDAEAQRRWAEAAMFYAASRVQHDTPDARWAAGLAEARAIAPRAIVDHGVPVRAVAISPDGARVASVDAGGHAIVWSAVDSAVIATKAIASRGLYAVAFAPSGRELAIGGDDGTIHRLTPELALIGRLSGHAGRVWALAYSPDGTLLASAGEDTTARVWPLDGSPPRTLAAHTQRVYTLDFSSDGRTLVTAADDRQAIAWDLATGDHRTVATHAAGGILAARLTPTGQLITAGWDHEVRMSSLDGGPPVAWSEDHDTHGAAIAAGGRALIVGGNTGVVRVWTLPGHDLLAALPVGSPIAAIATSRDGDLAVTASDSGLAIAWDLRPLRRLVDATGHQHTVGSVQLARDGREIVSSSHDNTIRVWDAATGAPIASIVAPGCGDSAVALGDDLAATCRDMTVRRWHRDGTLVGAIDTAPDWLRFMTVTPDGKMVLAGHLHGTLYAIDVAAWKILAKLDAHRHQLYDIVPRTDGRVVTASLDDTLKVWRGPSATGVLVLETTLALGTDDGVLTGSMSPDGTQLAAGTQDGRVVVRDLARDGWLVHDAGAARATALGTIVCLRYAPDGRHAYTASNDGLREWDTRTWTGSRLLDAGGGTANDLAISPDGRYLVGAYASGGIVLWDLATDRLARRIGGDAQHGTCADTDVTAWTDAGQREVVAAACAAEPDAYFTGLAARTHEKLADDVDVVWAWQ